MSGLVHTIKYIRLPTALEYRTFSIYFFSCSNLGLIVAESLKCVARGVQTILAFSMPKRRITFPTHSFYERKSFQLGRSLNISMPRILLAAPKSFISNAEPSRSFNLTISSILEAAINISST